MSIASVLETLRREYAPALLEEIRALEVACAAADWSAARRIAHRVGGTAGSYGFKGASLAARAIEDAVEPIASDLIEALKKAAAEPL